MATVNITYFRPAVIQGAGVLIGQTVATPQNITSSGTSQSTTATAPDSNTYARVVSTGGNVYIAVGTSPTVVTAQGILVTDGCPEYIKVESGQKIAVID